MIDITAVSVLPSCHYVIHTMSSHNHTNQYKIRFLISLSHHHDILLRLDLTIILNLHVLVGGKSVLDIVRKLGTVELKC